MKKDSKILFSNVLFSPFDALYSRIKWWKQRCSGKKELFVKQKLMNLLQTLRARVFYLWFFVSLWRHKTFYHAFYWGLHFCKTLIYYTLRTVFLISYLSIYLFARKSNWNEFKYVDYWNTKKEIFNMVWTTRDK